MFSLKQVLVRKDQAGLIAEWMKQRQHWCMSIGTKGLPGITRPWLLLQQEVGRKSQTL